MNQDEGLPEYPQVGVASTCRSYQEYCDMFNLEEDDLQSGPVLDVAGGASSFTAQLAAMNVPAVAVDPYYKGEKSEIIRAARREIETSSAKLALNSDFYDWSYYGSIEQHRKLRESSLDLFADDFLKEDSSVRYISASLPHLPFPDGTFSVVLCSHFLFLYGDQLSEEFHADSLSELLRVLKPGGELRIYPLLTLKWEAYPRLEALLEGLADKAQVQFLPTGLPFIPIPSSLLRMVKTL